MSQPDMATKRLSADEREALILEQMPQVKYIARRIHERLPQHIALEDLINAGVLGLMDAINKYDSGKNVQFRSYAQFRIRGAILDSLRESDWSPRDLRRKGRAIESAIQQLSNQLGRMPHEAEIASELSMSLSDYQQMLGDLRGLDIGSLTVESREEGGSEGDLCASIAVDETQGPFHVCLESEMRDLLAAAISRLSDREQQVLSLYYFEELTMKEIGTVLSVVESRVSQIHSGAVLKLRTIMREKLDSRPPMEVMKGSAEWKRY